MEFIQQNITWVMLAIVSGGMLIFPMLRGAGAAGVSVTEATTLINREDGVVLDVREINEWSAGHIPNARHIALGQLAGRLSELEKLKEKPIVVCCASGNRSSSACGVLRKAGFQRVYNLAGGIGAWSEAGLPVTTKH
ncbi:MAG: rhodanese-like domain-containing protein [Rhodocyclaceae bacterium]|nr:rhodanese-like domain-containing protein [Rhodocyclaceae bacterium]